MSKKTTEQRFATLNSLNSHRNDGGTLGMEIEMCVPYTGTARSDEGQRTLARQQVVFPALQAVVGGYALNGWMWRDDLGRDWTVKWDSSIRVPDGDYSRWAQLEIASPILTAEDRHVMGRLAVELSSRGCLSGPEYKCGIHVHTGSHVLDGNMVSNMIRTFAKWQDVMYASLNVDRDRESGYAMKLPERFVNDVDRQPRPHTFDEVARRYYAELNDRYMGLNVLPGLANDRYGYSNDGYKGTVEFRLFNGTLNPRDLEAAFALAMGLTVQAVETKNTSSKRKPLRYDHRDVRDYRVFLNTLGLHGRENKATRVWLVDNLRAASEAGPPRNWW